MSHGVNRNSVVEVHGIELRGSSVIISRRYAYASGPVSTTYQMHDDVSAENKYKELCTQYNGLFIAGKIRR